MVDVKFVTYCMNHGYFVHEEETPHLDSFSDHVLVEFMVTSGFLGNVGNFINSNIITPVSGTPTLTVSGFNTIEQAINYITTSGISSLNSISGTPTTSLSGYSTLEEAITSLYNMKVDKAGDLMTGFLTLSEDPTLSYHAVTKQYVDSVFANISGGSNYQEITEDYIVSTNSSNWIDVGNLNITSISGTYRFEFNADGEGSTNKEFSYALFKNDSIVDISERIFKSQGKENRTSLSTRAILILNPEDTVKVKYKASNRKTFKIHNRVLSWEKVI